MKYDDNFLKEVNMILIAEDDDIVRMILKRIIIQYIPKAEILECVDGQDALNKINEHCELVFTDNHMPQVSGMDLIKKIRMETKFSHIPVVMVTAENRPEFKDRAKNLGIQGWITKPFKEKDIIYFLNIYLRPNIKIPDCTGHWLNA